MRYQVIEKHMYGPAVVSDNGWLVDYGPLEAIQRICAALNAAENTAQLSWAVTEFDTLTDIEKDRVIQALSKRVRQLLQ